MEKLPKSILDYMWDVNKDKLDPQVNKNLIIERTLNYGTLSDWSWIYNFYNLDTIQKYLNHKDKFNRDNLRPETRLLASLIFK